MKKFSFVVQIPDEPGAIHRAAVRCPRPAANINQLQYGRRIDPATVFFEVTADEKSYNTIERELAKIGYLQIFLKHKGGGEFIVTTGKGESGKIFQSENLRRQT